MEENKYYRVGVIVSTQGLQGELRVKSTSDFAAERFSKGSVLSLFDETEKFVKDLKVTRAREIKNLWIVKFEGINDINQAETLRNYSLKISDEKLSELEEGEFYFHEIIGLEVREKDEKIGIVSDILQPGANDVWEVKRQGKPDLLLPYIPSVILSVNIAQNFVEVEIPEGLD